MKTLLLVVVAATALVACEGEPDCPTEAGYLSCGYCDEDRLLSSNPHAGMCTYCTLACGDDPCHPACDGDGGGGGCDASWVSRCGETRNGIQFAGQPHPKSCGSCPSGTHYVGDDTVSPGGPYNICICNGF